MINIFNNYANNSNGSGNNYVYGAGSNNVWWYQWMLIGLSYCISILLLLIPLIMIFVVAFSEGVRTVIINLTNGEMMHAVLLTVIVAVFTVPINMIFGMLMAWLITRFRFYGKQFLCTVLNIPFAVSPVIAGLLYLLLYTSNSLIGNWLDSYNIQVVFTWIGIVLVTIFVTFPFVVHELVPVMFNQGSQEDEAAILLGASGWSMFRYVTFPNIRWALFYGAIITNARAIGEFGAVSIVSGLVRGETYTLSLYVELLYQDYNLVGAFVAASLLACVSIFILLIKYYLQRRLKYIN